jgi:pimeloyl-ACP methyl ester carboxylesterase
MSEKSRTLSKGFPLDIAFSSFDGTALYGTLTRPEEPAKGVALFVHGITSDRSELGIFDNLSQRLAGMGIASLRFDYRGHGRSHLSSQEISLYGILSDVESAWLQLCAAIPNHQRLPLFAIGSSFGGGIAYRWATGMPNAAKVFLLAPVFDYFADIEKTVPQWKPELASTSTASYGRFKLSRCLINEARYFVSLDVSKKLQATIFHGTADHDVPFQYSQILAASLPFIHLVPLEGADHLICAPGDFYMRTRRSHEYGHIVMDKICSEVNLLLHLRCSTHTFG